MTVINTLIKQVAIEEILAKAEKEEQLSRTEIRLLLGVTEPMVLDRIFQTARKLRAKYFGSKVFLYGFVYFSTWCRNDCAFCYYRKSNSTGMRYRKTSKETVDTAVALAESGVDLIDLTMGEDPFFLSSQKGSHELSHLIGEIKRKTSLPVMISPGVVTKSMLQTLAEAGADWYACYQETHNKTLFKTLRVDQSYEKRLQVKLDAKGLGVLTEEGILTGVGETDEDIAESLLQMRRLGTQQVRVMTFVPQEGSTMEKWPATTREKEVRIIAIMRLLFPDRLIPASLDIDGIEGLQDRLGAGANVVTSIIPPKTGFAGVAQNKKDINEGYRTVAGIMPILKALSMEKASPGEYQYWVQQQKKTLSLTKQRYLVP